MQTSKHTEVLDPAVEILWRKLEEAKSRNANFSLRAFAQKLEMSSGSLSEILKGKRPLSGPVKLRIAPKLLLSPQETIQFFQKDLPEKMGISVDDRLTLSQDQFHLISDWWYFALLNLLKVRGFKNQLSWMAKRLGLTVQIVSEAWERLFRLGLIEQHGNQVVRKHPHLKTTDFVRDLSIRKSHLADLQLIENSLQKVPLELRDNTSCIFVIDKKDLPKVREFIRVTQNQFLQQFGKDTGEEVYKMTVALYPLTQVSGEQ